MCDPERARPRRARLSPALALLSCALTLLGSGCEPSRQPPAVPVPEDGGGASPVPGSDAGEDGGPAPDASTPGDGGSAADAGPWEHGTFRTLPLVAQSQDLVEYVAAQPAQPFGAPSPARWAEAAALGALVLSGADHIAKGRTDYDWCGARKQAAAAGYRLGRFHDAAVGRSYVLLEDAAGQGQATVVLDPEPARELVLEAPHRYFESRTAREAAFLFRTLRARALVLNAAHRCSSAVDSCCSGTTAVCGASGPFRISDVPHHTDNLFHLMHMLLEDWTDPSGQRHLPLFVQLHGMAAAAAGEQAVVADGTTCTVPSTCQNAGSISARFQKHLSARLPAGANRVVSCQAQDGKPFTELCATTNVQARYTHGLPTVPGPACPPVSPANACRSGTPSGSDRFLHVEQLPSLQLPPTASAAGYSAVLEALVDTYGPCLHHGGDRHCAAPPRAPLPDLPCP